MRKKEKGKEKEKRERKRWKGERVGLYLLRKKYKEVQFQEAQPTSHVRSTKVSKGNTKSRSAKSTRIYISLFIVRTKHPLLSLCSAPSMAWAVFSL